MPRPRTTSFLISLAGSRPPSPSERPLPSTPVFSKEEGERAKQRRNLDPGLAFPWLGSAATPPQSADEDLFPQCPSRYLTVLPTLHLQPARRDPYGSTLPPSPLLPPSAPWAGATTSFRRPLPELGAWSHPAGCGSWLLSLLAQERFPKSDVPAPRKGQAQ